MGRDTAAAGLGLGGCLELWAWLPRTPPCLTFRQIWSWLVLHRGIPLRCMTAARGASRAPIAETPEDGMVTSHLPTSI